MRHFQLRRVTDPATGVVRVRVTGLTIGRDDEVYIESDGYGGYRVEASKSSRTMTPSELETTLDYVRVALAEFGLGGFGRKTGWSEILTASF
jgi:hypothetical protein